MSTLASVVRTRYAPSPTGQQHIGGLRTALYNYLFAKARGGAFVLRIEDTDRARLYAGAEQEIIDSLAWLGIRDYEGDARAGGVGAGAFAPYRQSERREIHARYAQRLIECGCAYEAYDSDEELAELRDAHCGYDGRARTRTPEDIERLRAQGVRGVVRLLTPDNEQITWDDQIVGTVSVQTSDIPKDPVILKGDGYPTYHLAAVVDDHLMEITHVLRGQEWVSSTPIHLLIYRALGWVPPVYAHLPQIVGSDNKKLSKRHGAGALTVTELRGEGVLPEALCNYLARLGWSYDDSRELFTLADLERLFSLQGVQKSPARYDRQRLLWYNRHYMRELPGERFAEIVVNSVLSGETGSSGPASDGAGVADNTPHIDKQQLTEAVQTAAPELQERIFLPAEAAEWLAYLLVPTPSLDASQLVGKRLTAGQALGLVRHLSGVEESVLASPDGLEAEIARYAEDFDLHPGYSKGVVRYALSGAKKSLPLSTLLGTLSAQNIRTRLRGAVVELEKIV